MPSKTLIHDKGFSPNEESGIPTSVFVVHFCSRLQSHDKFMRIRGLSFIAVSSLLCLLLNAEARAAGS